jgi:hypothetical protein
LENFYGSSAGGSPIGLQFVVITLIADLPSDRVDPQAGRALRRRASSTSAPCLVPAVASAVERVRRRRDPLGHARRLGAIYVGLVASTCGGRPRTARSSRIGCATQSLPLVSYATLVVSAFTVGTPARSSLFFVGAAVLLLLFVGIHNAWDAITYHVFVQRREQRKAEKKR